MWQYKFSTYIYMYIDEISFCTIYIIMNSILVKQVMRRKNLELKEIKYKCMDKITKIYIIYDIFND